MSEFSARRALSPLSARIVHLIHSHLVHSLLVTPWLFMPVYVSPVSHASASRIVRGDWSCSVVVNGVERNFWIVRSRRSFRPSGIPQARAKRIR